MIFSDVTILDEDLAVREHQYVTVTQDRIAAIGDAKPAGDFGRQIDGRGKLLMSGFFNAHGHSAMSLLRGYGENLPLDRWLGEKIFPFEAKMGDRSFYIGTLLAMAESLRFGIVSTSDMYNDIENIVRAAGESGAKMNLNRGIVNFTGAPLEELQSFRDTVLGVEQYQGAYDGRIMIESGLHAEYTNDDRTARALAAYTKEHDLRMQVHVSETEKEHEECKARHGMTPMAWLAEMGLLDTPATAAHCVWVEEGDLSIMKEKGVTAAINPVSNLKLASGVANVQRFLDHGINVAIGTDGCASNNSLNFIEEMKVFALAPKMMYHKPESVSPRDTVYAATRAGALAQGREDSGLLKEGYKADLILIDIDRPWMYPVHDLLTNLVYSASGSDVCLTMVDGRVLYEDGEWTTIDIEKVKREAAEETRRILTEL